ncbi:MAG TPA: glycerophosphodiester phosphodiesterase [Chitinispirillaceae bacterium]|nr:glycerophosphodiester phosphodiesterase [Chitinispirillaceae bacterium]
MGHRGHPCTFHENTLKSFKSAIDHGADYIEFDVRRTADNVLIAFHDPSIRYNGKDLPVATLTIDNLQQVATEYSFQVARIDEIFSAFSKYCGFDIELKSEGCEKDVLSLIKKHSNFTTCFFTSFDQNALRTLKSLDPAVKTGYLFESPTHINSIDSSCIDYLCPEQKTYINYKKVLRSEPFSTKQVAVWTVDDPASMKAFFNDPDIFAVITNRCDLALQAYTL